MQKLTCDEAIMKQITLDTQDYTNNEKAMEEIANSDYASDFLGGQNHIALFAEAAKKIDMSNAGPYDQGLNESFQNAFKDYFHRQRGGGCRQGKLRDRHQGEVPRPAW